MEVLGAENEPNEQIPERRVHALLNFAVLLQRFDLFWIIGNLGNLNQKIKILIDLARHPEMQDWNLQFVLMSDVAGAKHRAQVVFEV